MATSSGGGSDSVPGSASCDINGASFEPETYLNRLIKERSLTELMDKEAEMVQHIKSLDSDMQTLVYENYNKFISATDTIRTVRICSCAYLLFQTVELVTSS
jgi:Vps51/Vps67